ANPYDAFSTVPTLAERQGDFSSVPVLIVNPLTQQPFPKYVMPTSSINLAARGLLNFIPLPNLPSNTQNFHFITSATNNSDDFNLRFVRAFGGSAIRRSRGGRRNNFNLGFHYHTSDNQLTNPLPTVGGRTSERGIDIPLGYARSFGKLTNMARVDFNRNRISTRNLYAFGQDITGDL